MRRMVKGVLMFAVLVFCTGVGAADVGEVFNSSYAAEAKGKSADALKIIETAYNAKLDGNLKYVMKMRMAYLETVLNKLDQAALLYGEASEIMPRAIEPLNYQSYEYYVLKDWKKVQEVCCKALNVDPKHYYSRSRLAYACLCLGDYAGSLREYSKVMELYPLDMGVKAMTGWVYAYMKDKTKATQIFREVLIVNPINESAKAGMEYLLKN
ncbi:MAG: hypothetical protein V1752_03065 [Candidatus Firestonebacteria bacterium]